MHRRIRYTYSHGIVHRTLLAQRRVCVRYGEIHSEKIRCYLPPLKTQKEQKYENPNIWRGKKKKRKRSLTVGRGTLNTCAKFEGLSLKNGVDIGL